MQTDFCWNYFCASKGDIITEELYGSSNYKKLKEKNSLSLIILVYKVGSSI